MVPNFLDLQRYLTFSSFISRVKEEIFKKKYKFSLKSTTHYRTLAALGASVLLPSGTTRGRCILQKRKKLESEKKINK
jgi:hypothetical protein